MQCPRCGQPTHVLASRTQGVAVRRQRECGLMRNGELASPTCGLKFWSVETPIGHSVDVRITMGPKGFETEILRGKKRG